MLEGISVVVTCYNLERYIGQAIDSILAQRSGVSYEILVVDDCSTDASADIIARYHEVKLIRTPVNSGVLLATVLGLSEAMHDVVAFLDGDDVWHPDKLARLTDAFSSNPRVGLVTHDLRYIDSQGGLVLKESRPSREMPPAADSNTFDQLIRDGILEQSDFVWLGSAYAIRRSAVDAAGFCAFAERLPDPANTYQDWPLAVWCASQQDIRMGYIPEKLFDYRLHQANHSGDARTPSKAIRNITRTLNTLLAIEDIVQMHGPISLRAQHAILRKRRYYQYVLDLYQGRRVKAVHGFIASQPYVWFGDVVAWKEYARFAGVQVLGLDRFLRWLSH